MNTNDRLTNLLYDAQAELQNAIEHLEAYVRETNDRQAEAYIVDHLKIIAGRDHGFLANDLNLDDLLERVAPYDDEDEDDDTDDDDGEPTVHASDGRKLHWSESLGRYVTIPTD